MHVLRIEHETPDYDAWKTAFDADPLGRKAAGVQRYRVQRAADDPNYVSIDLEFGSLDEAEQMHAALQDLWSRVDVMRNPKARITEIVEASEL